MNAASIQEKHTSGEVVRFYRQKTTAAFVIAAVVLEDLCDGA